MAYANPKKFRSASRRVAALLSGDSDREMTTGEAYALLRQAYWGPDGLPAIKESDCDCCKCNERRAALAGASNEATD
jgi:hypothetical protein